jgi:hypothetical protein
VKESGRRCGRSAADANWSGDFVGVDDLGDGRVQLALSWDGRDGKPISRVAELGDVIEGERFTTRIVDDSSLENAFWANYVETVELGDAGALTRVTVEETDDYRGGAFLLFRYFALRRKQMKLKRWAETGVYRPGGIFERPLTQFAMALVSILILWSLTGFSVGGLAFATC